MATKSLRSIRIKNPAIPAPAQETLARIRGAGFEAYLAGGCVRDLLLKRKPKDWDIVSNAPLDALKGLFPSFLEVGVSFGILKFPPQDGVEIDVAIFREEEGYSDLRRPDRIAPGTLKTDQTRRDFTINALYLDSATNEIIDGVGGIADLKKKLIRTVGAPKTRFSEDALRILRAARFSAQLGFRIEARTRSAMKANSKLLSAISRERIREETMKALSTKHVRGFLVSCASEGLWPFVFGNVTTPKVSRFRGLRASTEPVSPLWWLAALELAGFVGDLQDRLRLSSQEHRKLTRVQGFFADMGAGNTSKIAPQQYVELELSDPGLFSFVLATARKLRPSSSALTKRHRKAVRQLTRVAKINSHIKWPQARELITEGLQPGPALGEHLNKRLWALFWSA